MKKTDEEIIALTGLTKENCFDAIEAKYPKAMKAFKEWLDKYKESVEWEKLFNYGHPAYAKQGWHNPKFHDLPFELQLGILFRWGSEATNETQMFTDLKLDIISGMNDVFDEVEELHNASDDFDLQDDIKS